MRGNRSGQTPENTPTDALANAGDTAAESTNVDERAADAGQIAPAAAEPTKRGPRPSIDLGEIKVRPSTRTDFSTRATSDTNPVFKAVSEAEIGVAVDLVVKAESADAVKRKVRVAGQKAKVGISLAGDTPQATDEDGNPIEGYVLVTFKTKAKDDAEAVAAAPAAE